MANPPLKKEAYIETLRKLTLWVRSFSSRLIAYVRVDKIYSVKFKTQKDIVISLSNT
jgi:hypothetical protein